MDIPDSTIISLIDALSQFKANQFTLLIQTTPSAFQAISTRLTSTLYPHAIYPVLDFSALSKEPPHLTEISSQDFILCASDSQALLEYFQLSLWKASVFIHSFVTLPITNYL